jgi:hypothetical protein
MLLRNFKPLFVLLVSLNTLAQPAAQQWQLLEPRYCGSPARDADGDIVRSSTVTTLFQYHHPCPSTMSKTGPCPGWAKDHVIPLACGGCDGVFNMQWLDTETKKRKDGYERKIYSAIPPYPNTPACNLQPR